MIEELAAEYRPITDALIEHHGSEIDLVDMSRVSGFADAFIIVTARSELNARTLRDAVTDALDEMGIAYRVEGANSSRWSLIDAGDVVIHIFSREARAFYRLDRLWGDAPVMRIEDDEL